MHNPMKLKFGDIVALKIYYYANKFFIFYLYSLGAMSISISYFELLIP